MKKIAWGGIDPGGNGCLAMLTRAKIYFHDFKISETSSLLENEKAAAAKLDEWHHYFNVKFLLEKIQAIRIPSYKMKDGTVKGGFVAGQKIIARYAAIRGMLIALNCNWIEKTPMQWQKIIPDKSKQWQDKKERSLYWSKKFYPSASRVLSRKMDSDRADALLMAHYIRMSEPH